MLFSVSSVSGIVNGENKNMLLCFNFGGGAGNTMFSKNMICSADDKLEFVLVLDTQNVITLKSTV